MTPLQLAAFNAHAQTAAYQRKLQQLQALIVERIDPQTSYVSFSAGKDSAVIAHAVQARYATIPILMVDPGCPTHWLDSEKAEWIDYAQSQGWRLTLFDWDKWGARRDQDSITDYQQQIHADMFTDLQAYADSQGLTCRIMGMRAAESRNRRMNIGRRGAVYQYANGGMACLPIATWQTDDVWAYIVTHQLPWLGIYDTLGPNARNGLVGRSGEEYGRIEYLKQHYPDVWRWAKAQEIL